MPSLFVGNRTEAIIAIIAAQFIGLKSVSLHPMASEEDHAFVLQDAQVKALVVDNGKYAQRALAIEARGIVPLILPLDGDTRGAGLFDEAATMDGDDLALDARPGDITKLSYTGGTTGRSKGILHSHRTAVTMVLQMLAAYEWPERIRYLVTTPISHAAGGLILPVFIRGGTVYLSEKFTPADFLERVRRHRINFTFLVPTQIYGLLDHPGLANGDCSSLELALYGAGPHRALQAAGSAAQDRTGFWPTVWAGRSAHDHLLPPQAGPRPRASRVAGLLRQARDRQSGQAARPGPAGSAARRNR